MTEEPKEHYKIHEIHTGMVYYFLVYDTQKPFPECIWGIYPSFPNAVIACEKLNKTDKISQESEVDLLELARLNSTPFAKIGRK